MEYDGTGFFGFQRQKPGGPPTVQAALERALSKILDSRVVIKAAGRTDAGVHATGQVVALETASDRPLEVVVRGANALLPQTIRVIHAREVPGEFHPRFSAERRAYHYYLLPGVGRELLFRDRLWALERPLDCEAMARAAEPLLGTHDFSAFCTGVDASESRIRDLYAVTISAAPAPLSRLPFARLAGLVTVEVEANAFLRRMVRLLVGTLVKVGLSDWPPERPAQVLAGRDPGAGATPAPPGGLYLVRVDYPEALLRW